MLGLTATPDRSDGANLLALCGENLVYRCDVIEGIERELLSPFRYFGIPDLVDYTNIPWRSGRFDPEQLDHAVASEQRAANALDEWQSRSGMRTLAFCVSQRHANFMNDYFRAHGIRSVSVHTGNGASPRADSLVRLQRGELDIVFAVDMFNEGVDVPEIDTILMLRPTESKVLWIQQFGRGLRRSPGKPYVTVIDYIGNHRSFLQGPMILLPGASESWDTLVMALRQATSGTLDLPLGCEVTYELEAINILNGLLPQKDRAFLDLTQWYQRFQLQHGTRPMAIEAYHAGYDPKIPRDRSESWMQFVQAQADLTETEQAVITTHRDFFSSLETTPMSKSYKMVLLLGMISKNAFPGEIEINLLCEAFAQLARRSAVLVEDVGPDLATPSRLKQKIENNPINAWTGGRGTDQVYFKYEEGVFSSMLTTQNRAQADVLREFTRELSEWRLAQYINRKQSELK